jgi:arabinose-5-phosphate isomerase
MYDEEYLFDKHLQEAVESIQSLPGSLNPEEVVTAVGLFRKHPRIVFGSMGKPAFAVNKVVYTARSFGLDWHNLDVTHCFHGDAGIVKRGDLLVMVSKSGNTSETNEVADYFDTWDRLAVTSNPMSRLAEICDYQLIIPVAKEASPFGYAPMMSTTLYMIVLHAILCDSIKYSGCSLEEYARNHPGGDIGLELKKYQIEIDKD